MRRSELGHGARRFFTVKWGIELPFVLRAKETSMNNLKYILTLTSLGAVIIAGCGSSAMPLDKLTDAKATVRAAQEAGAKETPQAQLHLKMANDELASVQKAIDDNDNDRARLLLNQAQADADLSLALARGSADKQAAQAAQAKVVDLSKQAQ
jgi:hypothetical protein